MFTPYFWSERYILEWSNGSDTYSTGIVYSGETSAQSDKQDCETRYPQYQWSIRKLERNYKYRQFLPPEMLADISKRIEEIKQELWK